MNTGTNLIISKVLYFEYSLSTLNNKLQLYIKNMKHVHKTINIRAILFYVNID